jgi:hypothetical protein
MLGTVFRHDRITTEAAAAATDFLNIRHFRHLGMTQNCIHEEISRRLNSGKNLLPFSLQFLFSYLLPRKGQLNLLHGAGNCGLHVGNMKFSTQNEE